MHQHRVVAAIDFGTHGTGYAWAVVDPRSRTKSQREVIDKDQWPGAPGQRYPKTLSAVLLHEGDLIAWGHEAPQRRSKLKRDWDREDRRQHDRAPGASERRERQQYQYLYGLKMSLRPRDDPAWAGSRAAIADDLADPTSAIGSFLREIVRVAVAEITATGVYDESDIRWCLTVPAIWDQRSLQQMRRAAAAAGLPEDRSRLLLVPEPDAAALYCDVTGTAQVMDGEAGLTRGLRRTGMRFLVVDCGGGTADLVSYVVSEDESIDQLCRPSGGPFGAEYSTREFLLSTLTDRLGGEVNLEARQSDYHEQFAKLTSDWERSRNTFTVDREDPVYVDIPSRLLNNLGTGARRNLAASQADETDDQIVIPAAEMRQLLDSVVGHILGKVDEQLSRWDSAPDPAGAGDCLYLVGGFAQSPYLQRRIADHVGGRLPVRLPQRPERAVLHGAVHYCYDPTLLRARRSKYTYGCEYNKYFERGDNPEYVFFTKTTKEKRTKNSFHCFVSIDERVPVDKEVFHDFVPTEEDQKSVSMDFYSTLEPRARYVTEPGMKKIGSVSVSLAGAMSLPRAQRTVRIWMKFGEADIQARAVNVATGHEEVTTLDFESTL